MEVQLLLGIDPLKSPGRATATEEDIIIPGRNYP